VLTTLGSLFAALATWKSQEVDVDELDNPRESAAIGTKVFIDPTQVGIMSRPEFVGDSVL
jgi:hypothetical protein